MVAVVVAVTVGVGVVVGVVVAVGVGVVVAVTVGVVVAVGVVVGVAGCMSLRFFARIFNRLIPFDSDDRARAGWASIKLDESHPFNRCAVEHDYNATIRHAADAGCGGVPVPTQAQSDIELFLDMAETVRGRSLIDEQGAIELIYDACAFWPVARKFGKLRSGE